MTTLVLNVVSIASHHVHRHICKKAQSPRYLLLIGNRLKVSFSVPGLGRTSSDGGKPAHGQVDPREMRLPRELQCGLDKGRAQDHRFGATFA